MGVSLVAPRASFFAAGTNAETSIDNKASFLPQGFVTYRLGDVVSLGLGVYLPFGLKLEWPETSPGRTIVREIELRTYYVSPAVAHELSQWAPGLVCGGEHRPRLRRCAPDPRHLIWIRSRQRRSQRQQVQRRGERRLFYRPEASKTWQLSA